jgi:hypothetical protein
VATVVVNKPDQIEFKNIKANAPPADAPTLTVQAGNWETADGSTEAGVVVDVYGPEAPILTPADARKLAKWLTRAADELEGTHKKNNKHKHYRHYEPDDDNTY